MRRNGLLPAALLLACSGLSACAPAEVTVPSMETPSSHHFSATYARLNDVEYADGEVCPFMDRTAGRTLVVFEPGAVGQAHPAGVIVDGVTLLDGTAFRAGPLYRLKGGHGCGGTHDERAVLVIGDVTLDD